MTDRSFDEIQRDIIRHYNDAREQGRYEFTDTGRHDDNGNKLYARELVRMPRHLQNELDSYFFSIGA